MHEFHRVVLAVAMSVAAWSAAAASAGSIEDLMDALRVGEVAKVASAQITGDADFRKMPAAQQACIGEVFSAPSLVAAIQPQYEALFATPAIRAEASAFLRSPVGMRMVDSMLATANSGGDDVTVGLPAFLASLSPSEMKAVEAFAATDAGKAFAAFPAKSEATQLAAAQRLADRALRECGPPGKD